MSLVVFEDVTLGFGKKTIVDSLDLRLGQSDRIGLIGPNGSGKTSLLRLLSGEQAPDGGRIRKSRGVRVGYLPQDIATEGGRNLLDFVRSSVQGRAELDGQLADTEAELKEAEARGNDDEMMSIVERLSTLHERIAHFDMHFTDHAALRILAGLGFSDADRDRDLGEFSGGWKMRAVLASLLFQQPDLLLLDEPTNHLDMPSVAWFSDFLKRYDRAFILICHDREFLNEQIARVVSFETEGVRQYEGDYELYQRQRAEEEVILENKAKNLAREREQTERFINRFRAQATKARAVQSRVKQLDKMESVETYQKRKVMRFSFPETGRSVAEPLVLKNVSKVYGERTVLKNVSLTVKRGEKIGIIGVNGAGKTTLLKMIAGELPVTSGEITLGHNIVPGYYAQHHAEALNRNGTIYEEVAQQDRSGNVTRIRTVLGAFLYSGDDIEKKIAVLSGGERARVALARLLVNPGPLLMMDEPTNHLDLESSESLADSLSTYDGTLIFVSHNRSFVRKLATRIWNVADGTVDTYPGTLDEYMDSVRQRLAQKDGTAETRKAAPNAPAPPAKSNHKPPSAPASEAKHETRVDEKERKRREAQRRDERNRKLGPLKRKVETLEAKIATLEQAQKERSDLLADPAVYADKQRSNQLIGEFKDAATRLASATEEWERAQAELDKLESQDQDE